MSTDVSDLVPLHPEPVDGEPTRLRWVAPAERVAALGFVGEPVRVPDGLAALLVDGTLAGLTVTPTAVVATVGDGRSWRTDGARVRSALQSALADPAGWVAPAGSDPDDALRMAVDEVIAGEVGDYVRSHGGELRLLSAHDDRVEVSMTGTCGHCPAADDTLNSPRRDGPAGALPGSARGRRPGRRGRAGARRPPTAAAAVAAPPLTSAPSRHRCRDGADAATVGW